jgi:hypothetical protein
VTELVSDGILIRIYMGQQLIPLLFVQLHLLRWVVLQTMSVASLKLVVIELVSIHVLMTVPVAPQLNAL